MGVAPSPRRSRLSEPGRHRVDDDDVDGAAADKRFRDLQGLLAGIGLRHDQVVDVDAQLAGIARVERMLGVDKGRRTAGLLGFGDHVQGDRGLT